MIGAKAGVDPGGRGGGGGGGAHSTTKTGSYAGNIYSRSALLSHALWQYRVWCRTKIIFSRVVLSG